MERVHSQLRVLLIEDSEEDVAELLHLFESWGYFVSSLHVRSAAEMEAALEERPWDLVISNPCIPGFDTRMALDTLQRHGTEIPLIALAKGADREKAARVMKAGARDFVTKDELALLKQIMARALRDVQNRRDSSQLEARVKSVNCRLEETLNTLTKTQEQLVRIERFKALGQLASGVAHDFNNALTKMLGIIELTIAQSGSEEPPPHLKKLKITALEAANIVRRLRAFYRPIGVGEAVEAMDVNKVIEAAIDMTKPKWKGQSAADGCSISVQLDLEEIPNVNGKIAEFQEAFANLVFNACDAMPKGGRISISSHSEEESVVVEFADNGEGMSEEVRQRCLEPYYTTKGKSRTGMGLALVDGLTRRFAGTLDCESAPGNGTTFTMRFPTVQSPEKDCDSGDTVPVKLPSMHILVADDDLAVSLLIMQFLRLDGHEVDIVKDGQEALECFDSEHHEIVISDRAMPVMDGDILAAAIKARSPRTPVIMASGFVDAMTGADEKPPGVDYLLRKPITREDLRLALVKARRAA